MIVYKQTDSLTLRIAFYAYGTLYTALAYIFTFFTFLRLVYKGCVYQQSINRLLSLTRSRFHRHASVICEILEPR